MAPPREQSWGQVIDAADPELVLAWKRTHGVLLREAARLHRGRRSCGLTGAQAVAHLTKKPLDGPYSLKPERVERVTMLADAIDEPLDPRVVPMLQALPPEDAELYAHEEHVVDLCGKSMAVFSEIEAHFGFVGGSQEEYLKYLLREDLPPQMWCFLPAEEVKAVAGFATVPKKQAGRQRKLLMQCATNYLWIPAQGRKELGMLGGGALSRVYAPGDRWRLASFDESNAFTSVLCPPWMWPWCAGPPVRAGQVRRKLPPRLAHVPYQTWIFPCYMRLAMGSTHSVLILMSINLTSVGRSLIATCRLWVSTSSPEALRQAWPELQGVEDDDDDEGTDDAEWTQRREKRQQQVQSMTAAQLLSQLLETVRAARQEEERVFVLLLLFSGPRRPDDIQEWVERLAPDYGVKVLVISSDVEGPWPLDFADPQSFASLSELVEEGAVDGTGGGSPCNTWSRLRFLPGGPRPLRMRGKWAWGLPDLTPTERERVNEGNVLAVNFITLCEKVSARGGVHLQEHPDDPGEDPYPSLWDTELQQEMERRTGASRARLQGCTLGAPTRKDTLLSGTVDDLDEGNNDEYKCPGVSATHIHERSRGKDTAGKFLSQRLARYQSPLCRFLAIRFLRSFRRMHRSGTGPGGWQRSRAQVARITAWGSRRSSLEGEPAVAILNEEVPRHRGVVINATQAAMYLHVDDGVVIDSGHVTAGGKPWCDTQMHRSADALESCGFRVDARSTCEELEKIVGYVPERCPARLRLGAPKAGQLYEALWWLAGRRRVNTEALRSIMGSWVWGALLKRELLAIPHAVFSFIERYHIPAGLYRGGPQRGVKPVPWLWRRPSCTRTWGRRRRPSRWPPMRPGPTAAPTQAASAWSPPTSGPQQYCSACSMASPQDSQ